MASTRAAELAELLWELKRADKLATFTTLARRAGFSPGANGRTVITTIKAVRRGWPHLQWWRAVSDDGVCEKGSEHEEKLVACGYQFQDSSGKNPGVMIVEIEKHLMVWNEETAETAAAVEA
jgi:alkylated DNA nucleotide flippase Atl1